MIIVLDTNIVLDALLERKPFNADAEKLLVACVGKHAGCLTANALTDIFYVVSKSIGAAKAKLAIKKMIELLEVISVSEEDCINALELPLDDFEDALVSVCAAKRGADYIISRDSGFQSANSPVTVLAPDGLIKMLEQ